jgi:hypothetical protein
MSASSRPHRGAFGGQGQGQVHGGGRLADAALAAGHGDDVLDAGDQLDALLHGVGDHLGKHIGADVADARQLLDFGDYRRAQPVDLALCRIAELDVERDVIAVDLDVPDAATADQILAGVGVDNVAKCGLDALFVDGHGSLC